MALTARCNLRCSYCYQTAENSRRMDWATLKASIEFACECGLKDIEVIFLGGEPLLEWSNLRKAIAYAERKSSPARRIRCTIVSNAMLITDPIAGFLDRHGVHARLSFDGISGAQDYRKKGSFIVIDRLLEGLRDRHPDLFRERLQICITLIPPAIEFLADSVAYLLDKGVQDIAISPCLTPYPGWTKDRIGELEDQFSRLYATSLRHFRQTEKVPLSLFRKSTSRRRSGSRARTMCGVIDGRELMIDTDGQAFGCVMLTDSYQTYPSEFLASRMRTLRLGDFRDPGFWRRYAGFPEAARKTQLFHDKAKKYSSYGDCGACRYLDDCQVCPVSIGYDPGNSDPRKVAEFLCAFNMVALKYRRRFPLLPNPVEKLAALIRNL